MFPEGGKDIAIDFPLEARWLLDDIEKVRIKRLPEGPPFLYEIRPYPNEEYAENWCHWLGYYYLTERGLTC